jgi:surface protein
MFWHAYTLEELEVANWDVGNVTNFQDTFAGSPNAGDMNLKKLEVENWDVSSATNLRDMFYSCGDLVEMDLSAWDVRNVKSVSHMFADCFNLEAVDFSGWETPNLVSMDGMFNDCRFLKTVDLSMFDTRNVREFSQLFEACKSLETIIGLENFVTSSGHDFSEMFSGCGSLKELDLSTFDTRQANIKYIAESGASNWMFRGFLDGCSKLEKLSLSQNLSFDGDGTAVGVNVITIPAASGIPGWDGYWYDANGNAYAPSEIPEETAATYYAVKPANP